MQSKLKTIMKLTFLGTGTSKGIPVIGSTHEVCLSTDLKDKRLRSSLLIAWDNYQYVIDCGPDFRQQMLRADVSRIDGIIYTHEHADHTAGLDDIRPFTQKFGDLPLYASQRVMDNLKKRFDYIFTTENKYPSAPSVQENIIDHQPFKIGNKQIIPIEVKHGNLTIFSYRIDKVAYLTDVSFISENEKKKLKDLDVLIVNALQIKSHFTHFNLEKALELIDEVKPKKAFLTHISHKLGFHKVVEKSLPENVFLAYDGLHIIV